jgi:hypothetical protein
VRASSRFDAFVIFDDDDAVHPRLVAVYPRPASRRFSQVEADAIVDLILPPAVRGVEEPPETWLETRHRGRRRFPRRVSVDYDMPRGRKIARIGIIGNGIQGPTWDPIALLEQSYPELT